MSIRCAVAAIAIATVFLGRASAHRLDEYLQATLISLDRDRVQLSMRLIPGVAVYARVLESMDINGDGVLSADEQRAYANQVVRDLTLQIDQRPLQLRITAVQFPTVPELKEGLGEVHLEVVADLPHGGGQRSLRFENHYQSRISVYLVNTLASQSPGLRVVSQNRNELQSLYRLDYVKTRANGSAQTATNGLQFWLRGAAGMFRLGMRHIAEGTDHLLFLLALLLPAPLLALGGRWDRFCGIRQSARNILAIVSAFTAGHSLTLGLAAFNMIAIPSRPVEVFIAVSILVSAWHALRPIFPGREAWVAAGFGLIHGLAFAGTLGELGVSGWERFRSLLAFNLGIEAMQVLVVVATLPSLVLLAQTGAYRTVRVCGGLFAAVAAGGWIGERLLGLFNPAGALVEGLASREFWIAPALFLISLLCWLYSSTGVRDKTRCPANLPAKKQAQCYAD